MRRRPSYEELEYRVQELTEKTNELKKNNKVLKHSQERLQAMADASFEAIFFSEKGICIDQNRAAQSVFGYTREEAVGRPNTDWIVPEDRGLAQKKTQENRTEPYQVYALRKDSSTFPCEIQEYTTEYLGRNIKITALRDSTHRKRSEELNQQSRQEIESIFRSAPTGIGVVSDRVITKVNNRVEEISGYSKEELIGQNARMLYPSDEEFNYVGEEKYRQINIHETGTVETRWQRKDGVIIDILMSSTPIDMNDHSKGVTFTALDITETKKNEAALLESEEKYRSMMEAQKDPTYISSSDYNIEYMNPAMHEWLGRNATGEKCYKAIWGFSQPCSWCRLERVFAGEKITSEIKKPDSDQTYHVASAPIYHVDGSMSKLTSYRDISEIRQMSIRLQQAQKMESIGNLAGGIAHDFNNILFPIVGSELLLEDFSDGTTEYANVYEILKAGRRGSELVKQILAFSRQDENKMMPTPIQNVLKEVLKLTRSTIPSDIEIHQDIQQDCNLINGNATQIHQVVMNLITNAFHAVEDSGGHIHVTLSEKDCQPNDLSGTTLMPGRYAKLSVFDNGCGIQPSVMEQIFEPYFTTKAKGKGTGLGLSVVYGIVKDHEGDIKVHSRINKGSTFNLFFPIINQTTQSEAQEKEEAVKTGTEKILLVDDEAPIVKLGKAMLERLGYQVHERTSSIDALEAFKAAPASFDLVISDMTMPNMTGDQLARKIHEIRQDIPIIICSGFSDRIGNMEMNQLGIKALLMKPVVKSELANTIRKSLDGSNEI